MIERRDVSAKAMATLTARHGDERELVLDMSPLGGQGLSALAAPDALPRLTTLGLGFITTATGDPKWAKPSTLEPMALGWIALFKKNWPELTSVDLQANFLGLFRPGVVRALLDSGAWPSLRELNLEMNELSGDLFSAPLFQRVERLSLRHNPLGRSGAESLARGKMRLRSLDLSLTKLDLDETATVLRSPVIEPVEELRLDNLFLGDELAKLLTRESKRLTQLRVLHVELNNLSEGAKARLSAAYPRLSELKFDQQEYGEEWR